MENKTKLFTVIMTVAILSGIFVPYVAFPHKTQRSNFWVFKETSAGRQLIGETHNVIVNYGEREHRNRFGFNNGTADAIKYISLGNATVAQTLSKLTTECTTSGFTRAAADTVQDYYSSTDYGYNATKTFTATGTIRINAAGLHWIVTSNSDNNMFAAAAITETTFNTSDKCIIIWLVTCDDN